jgi:copper chaperone CopZ
MNVTIWTVTGMTCDHCVHAVQKEVSAVPGVTSAEVELATGLLTVTSDAPVEESSLRDAVDEAGYVLVGPAPTQTL